MTFTHRPVDPVADLDLLHAWVTEPRAEFWGMTTYTRDEVGEVYTFLDGLTTHHAYLVHRDDLPVAIFQTYQPAHDPVGETYDVQEGDVGCHLFVAPADVPEPGFTGRLAMYLLGVVLADPAVRRIVAEPDVRNAASIARAERIGLQRGDVVQLPDKTAQLAFITRAALE
ncbi:GNAT family N-acetyltransferase [Aeromicrobium endophyticum]|uniref:Lysine N-acyltransferase MbtK n=1 Tax=Aeromicrobium endophyticum TaxID=2292704 RepID=A0A371P9L5_9ACTN|nr:GNAT family N-acetyltransferase [Aeromicrobium endophyticum]REK72582.1 N-acetyltransferase [Aeromicrobium endophyticum]